MVEEELMKVIDMFIQNAEKLAPLVNNTIGNRAPKIWHYGASESNNFRLACPVSQNNLAHNDVSEVSIAVCCFRELYTRPKSLNRAFENPSQHKQKPQPGEKLKLAKNYNPASKENLF